VIVVSNTSPIINLAMVGELDLLQKLYSKITIPEAVRREIAIEGAGQPGASEVETLDWIEVCQVVDRTAVALLQAELDDGEAEAIALAVELEADLVLLDERKGRAIAGRLGLKFVGLLALLIEAKQKGAIAAVKPVVDSLIEKAGFWINAELYNRVLKAAGE
jgi:uncharacterized protein